MNQVVLVGRTTKDAELRYIPGSGTPVATFTVAIDRDFIKKDGTKDTDFIPVEVMGKLAEFAASYVTKGRLISVQGNLRVDRYMKDDENRTYTKVAGQRVRVLDSNKNKSSEVPKGLDPEGFQAIDDDEIPF